MKFFCNSRKASISLSVNFLVRLILAIVVFGFGMIIVKNIFFKADSGELTKNIDEQVESQIKILLDTGEKITVYPEQIEVKSGENAVFAVGVMNILELPTATNFKISVECSAFIARNGDESECPAQASEWTFADFDPLVLKNNEYDNFVIPMLPSNAEKGVYVYNAGVTYGSENKNYGIVKFRVKVK